MSLKLKFADCIGLEEVGRDEYVSTEKGVNMGNARRSAYGGNTQAWAVHAACRTVPEHFKLYSVLGHFLGPTSLDLNVTCRVTRTRDTKTFATRRVQLIQFLPDGRGERLCLELVADFMVVEPAMMEFSAPPLAPMGPYSPPEACPSRQEHHEDLEKRGLIKELEYKQFKKIFEITGSFMECKYVPESISGQTLEGAGKYIPHTQEHLSISDRTSAEWYRAVEGNVDTTSQMEQWALVAFLLDGGLAFLPLVHSHRVPMDSGATSSLDFALRFFQPEVHMERWHMRERRTHAAAVGRNFSEARLWDDEGNLVACMSQQCIMRPPPPTKKSAL